MTIDRSYRHTAKWRGEQRRRALALTGGRCAMCGDPGSDGRGKGLHQPHIIPAGPGIPNDNTNIAPIMCASCHRRWDASRKRTSR